MTRLPTRILDIGPQDGTQDPHLFITNNSHAPYAALSHCWGKHRILTTMTYNLAEHCQVIKLSALPKTFQDAIVITRYLGLRYLWIDSLCIVQDDAEDWRRESVQMGRVYKDAAVTIAASGAKDGTEGCFIRRPMPDPPVRLPYEHGSIYVSLFPNQEDCSMSESPLGSRAWITQEWMLSPRTIHYTKAKMTWTCRTLLKCEDGENEVPMDEQRLFEGARKYRESKARHHRDGAPLDTDDMLGFYVNWCDLVTMYTSRSLTYETDKPVAIIGLATEVGLGVGETYTAGVFHGDCALHHGYNAHCIAIQLLWFAKSILARPHALQNQPSWSWASTIGAVSFLAPARTARNLVHDIQVCQGTRHFLRLTARVRRWEFAKPRPDAVHGESGSYPAQDYYARSTLSFGGVASQKPFYFNGPDKRPAGWVVFDLGSWPSRDKAFHVAAFSGNDMNGEPDGFNVMFLGEMEVSASHGGERRFTKLGVGQILDSAWFDGAQVESIILA